MNIDKIPFDLAKKTTLLNAKLPDLPQRPRKNLFDILKIQHREIRNSNILAYFFDPNEEHSFGSLFYDALLEISADKITALKKTHPHIIFEDIGTFDEINSVRTEEQTDGAAEETKSIDIVLEGEKWVIGIENKINHKLVNPLDIYWEHLQSKNKSTIGIVLSLKAYTPEECKADSRNYFLNVTHQELLEKVQSNVQLTGDSSSTDLFYLREYFKNIESHYYHLKETPEMDKVIEQIVKNYRDVNEIVKKKEAAEKHIDETILTSFEELDYVKVGRWFMREDKKFDLYFYVKPASELMERNALWLFFEIRGSANANENLDKKEFTSHFKKEFEGLPNFNQSNLEIRKNHTHAFTYYEEHFFSKNISFKNRFNEVLETLINAENAPVKKVEQYLENQKVSK